MAVLYNQPYLSPILAERAGEVGALQRRIQLADSGADQWFVAWWGMC